MSDALENQLARFSLDSEISERNRKTSPLLRLPGELRNTIYELVVVDKTWIMDAHCDDPWISYYDPPATRSKTFGELKIALHLVRVCRQIHVETSLLAFTTGVFKFAYGHTPTFNAWLDSRTSAQQEAVTRIEYNDRLQVRAFKDPTPSKLLLDHPYNFADLTPPLPNLPALAHISVLVFVRVDWWTERDLNAVEEYVKPCAAEIIGSLEKKKPGVLVSVRHVYEHTSRA